MQIERSGHGGFCSPRRGNSIVCVDVGKYARKEAQ